MNDADNTTARGAPARYEIRVRGHLGETLLAAFPAFEAQRRGGDTVLSGPLARQATLYSVLARIAALGLELCEVRRADG